ncbi:hypothetical protein DL98DRAFT_521177 [Cadophora sp. DSE1049]|nr:hypothetical protein DL98DRAFT_521177 [Cadophora sp. DSE1049]
MIILFLLPRGKVNKLLYLLSSSSSPLGTSSALRDPLFSSAQLLTVQISAKDCRYLEFCTASIRVSSVFSSCLVFLSFISLRSAFRVLASSESQSGPFLMVRFLCQGLRWR